MAIDSVSVTLNSVVKLSDNVYSIHIKAVCLDGADTVINKLYKIKYYQKPGISLASVLSVINPDLKDRMQKYTQEIGLKDNHALISLMDSIQNKADTDLGEINAK